MNNSQFRNLIGEQRKSSSSTSQNDFKKPSLGSRARASIPMTPRSLGSHNPSKDFARQIIEHKRETSGEPPAKKFKSNAAPRGTKFSSQYVDRSLERRDKDSNSTLDEDLADKVKRLKALEEMLKLQQIDQQTFDKLRVELGVGGDTSSTHMVKGLDWKLLERVRRGEDINKATTEKPPEIDDGPDVDEELERALEKDVISQEKHQSLDISDDKVTEIPSIPTSRDEILRRLKQSRLGSNDVESLPEPAAPVLGDKFKKLESSSKPGKKKFVEVINGRRREVLVITGKDGKSKRKTRWIDPEETARPEQLQAWGGDVSTEVQARQRWFEEEQKRKEAEEDEQANGDIFAGVGEYDPLAGLESDDSEEDDVALEAQTGLDNQKANGDDLNKTSPVTSEPRVQAISRNYFSTGKDPDVVQGSKPEASSIDQDPAILAALKRAAQLRQSDSMAGEDIEKPSNSEKEFRQRALLAKLKERDRQDGLDLDMGFGDSRFGDDDDDGEGDEALADWDAGDDNGQDGKRSKHSGGRKRGAKKRKGDKDNVQDVMSVLEGRQKK